MGRQQILNFMNTAVRLALGLLLLSSAIVKIMDPYAFLSIVYRYEMVGPQAGVAVALVVPAIELALAICLLANVMLLGASLTVSAISFIFLVAQSLAMHAGLHISCGCFSVREFEPISAYTITRAAIIWLISAAWFGYLLARARNGSKHTVSPA